MKIIAFDVDDVICSRDKIHESKGVEKYNFCFPIEKNINLINQCYNMFYVKLYTARGMTTYKGDLKKINENILPVLEKQLNDWNVKYHELIVGKTHYDLFIDDKAKNINEINNLEDVIKNIGENK